MSSSSQDLLNPLPYLRVRACYSPHIKGFLKACADNDLATSTHLAPINDTEALSVDLNIAIEGGHVELARQLISQGAKWDSRTIHLASESFQAVEMLLQCGFDANTRLIGGGVLLPLVFPSSNPEVLLTMITKVWSFNGMMRPLCNFS